MTFGDGPTREEVHELFHQTTVLMTMLTHPGHYTDGDSAEQAQTVYTLSPPYALVVLASTGAGRFWRLAHTLGTAEDPAGLERFPRDVLQTIPSGGRPDLLFLAIDLVETVARNGRARHLVDQLLVDGVRAYRVLLSVVHELGWLAARADPTVVNIVELVALEAVTAEQDWYTGQESH